MTRVEFASVMAYLSAGCGKALSDEATRVYFDLLGSLPLDRLRYAAQQALKQSQYPTFPTVGTLYQIATGTDGKPSLLERIREGRRAACGYAPDEKEHPCEVRTLTAGQGVMLPFSGSPTNSLPAPSARGSSCSRLPDTPQKN